MILESFKRENSIKYENYSYRFSKEYKQNLYYKCSDSKCKGINNKFPYQTFFIYFLATLSVQFLKESQWKLKLKNFHTCASETVVSENLNFLTKALISETEIKLREDINNNPFENYNFFFERGYNLKKKQNIITQSKIRKLLSAARSELFPKEPHIAFNCSYIYYPKQ